MNVNDDSSKIIVINDGCKSFAECPSLEDFQLYQELLRINDDEEDELDEDEQDSSDDEAMMERKGHMVDDAEDNEAVYNNAA